MAPGPGVPPLGFEDAVTDEAQALGRQGNQALGPATEQGEAWGASQQRPLEGTPEERREGWAGAQAIQTLPGSWQSAGRGGGLSAQAWAQAAAAPGRAECHHECHRPAASRLMALGNAPGCTVTFQLQQQGLTEPGGP